MTKSFVFLITIVLAVSLWGCGGKQPAPTESETIPPADEDTSVSSESSVPEMPSQPEEPASEPEAAPVEDTPSLSEPEIPAEDNPDNFEPPVMGHLVQPQPNVQPVPSQPDYTKEEVEALKEGILLTVVDKNGAPLPGIAFRLETVFLDYEEGPIVPGGTGGGHTSPSDTNGIIIMRPVLAERTTYTYESTTFEIEFQIGELIKKTIVING